MSLWNLPTIKSVACGYKSFDQGVRERMYPLFCCLWSLGDKMAKRNTQTPLVNQPQLIISVKEARKLLSKNMQRLTDDQVETMVVLLESIAREFIQESVPRFE